MSRVEPKDERALHQNIMRVMHARHGPKGVRAWRVENVVGAGRPDCLYTAPAFGFVEVEHKVSHGVNTVGLGMRPEQEQFARMAHACGLPYLCILALPRHREVLAFAPWNAAVLGATGSIKPAEARSLAIGVCTTWAEVAAVIEHAMRRTG